VFRFLLVLFIEPHDLFVDLGLELFDSRLRLGVDILEILFMTLQGLFSFLGLFRTHGHNYKYLRKQYQDSTVSLSDFVAGELQ
jgi:hypothetical protein